MPQLIIEGRRRGRQKVAARSRLAQTALKPAHASAFSNQNVQWAPIERLKPRADNPRTHTPEQIAKIARSLESFGFTNPVLVDRDGGVIAGHGRIEAAKRLGWAAVPTLRLDQLGAEQVRAYVIADNRLAELAGWDEELLALELEQLLEMDLDFAVDATGFEPGEIEMLIEGRIPHPYRDGVDDVPPLERDRPAVSRPGDLWCLGEHRLLCGDALDPCNYAILLAGRKANLVFADPPYNLPIAGHVSGLGRIKHREFPMASGEMTEAEFVGFLERAFRNFAACTEDGSIHFVCMDWRHLYEALTAARAARLALKNLCVWAKTNCGMGSFYRSQHELILVLKNGTGSHVNNFALGEHGRHRSNLWTYAGVNTFRDDRLEELAMHPTVKPVPLVADAIRDCSRKKDIVLDGFAGSGTTIVAAEETERRACAIELDPHYVDVAIRRWEKLTGGEARHGETGRTFAAMARSRTRETKRTTEARHDR